MRQQSQFYLKKEKKKLCVYKKTLAFMVDIASDRITAHFNGSLSSFSNLLQK